jgi:hypothetical protein
MVVLFGRHDDQAKQGGVTVSLRLIS